MKHLFAIVALLIHCGSASANADILLQIVQQCINTSKPAYCEQCLAPQRAAICPGKTSCKATSEVWRETDLFVAIRDIKMCGCPASFVHGLVLPKAVVTGIEDDRRPNDIWQFAWDVAIERIDQAEIALAVNSKSKRTQNQLHVHVVRLKPHIQERLDKGVLAHSPTLSEVWQVAAQAAAKHGMAEYGVLVTAAPLGGFQLALTQESPEGQFTQAVCSL